MLISSRGRYALRIMLYLASLKSDKNIPLKVLAEQQGVSLKYVSRIIPLLSSAGLVKSTHGKLGGYQLTRNPSEYTVGEILRLTEGNLAPVSCLACDVNPCAKQTTCTTLIMWKQFHKVINEYLDSVTLETLLEHPDGLEATFSC